MSYKLTSEELSAIHYLWQILHGFLGIQILLLFKIISEYLKMTTEINQGLLYSAKFIIISIWKNCIFLFINIFLTPPFPTTFIKFLSISKSKDRKTDRYYISRKKSRCHKQCRTDNRMTRITWGYCLYRHLCLLVDKTRARSSDLELVFHIIFIAFLLQIPQNSTSIQMSWENLKTILTSSN